VFHRLLLAGAFTIAERADPHPLRRLDMETHGLFCFVRIARL
jgi:hypothetical protein